nr:DNA integrity scanning protein DisA nucleotide-binding domain protein [Gimesia algae]
MHTDSNHIYGLVKYNSETIDQEKVFLINILDHHHWEILYADKTLMRVKYGQPYLPKPSFNEDKLRKDLSRIFLKMTPDQIDHIVLLVKEAEQEQHGTMLLIAENAEEESQRLSNQSTQITPKYLVPSILKCLTAIDGAIILDPKGTCFAIGAILDGMATQDGDPSRGARYNSALRYTKTLKSPCFIIVVSEDGGVDFIPDLKPAIKRTEIDARINTLNEIAEGELIYQKFQRKYNDTMQWLSAHRLYLSDQNCQLINDLMKKIAEEARCDDADTSRLLYGSFSEHPEFDPQKYYIDE